MNLGIDFGSTYSSFATYSQADQKALLCKPSHSESEAVPSVACLDDDGKLITGHEGRDRQADEEVFRLFHAVQDCIDDIEQLRENHECFVKVGFGAKKIPVTYSQLIRAYDSLIHNKLQECLQSITHYMDEAGIDYASPSGDDFHVVLAGGFGKYIFVQNQIQEFFDCSSTGDRRFQYDLGEEREYAVALGAALLAEGIISIRHTAPYAIGVRGASSDDASKVNNFAIRYRQEIRKDRDCWILNDHGQPKRFINSSSKLPKLLIGFDQKGLRCNELVIKPELSRRIERAYAELMAEMKKCFPQESNIALVHHVGFRMDESEIVTLLIRSVRTNFVKEIELKSFQEMFVLTEI